MIPAALTPSSLSLCPPLLDTPAANLASPTLFSLLLGEDDMNPSIDTELLPDSDLFVPSLVSESPLPPPLPLPLLINGDFSLGHTHAPPLLPHSSVVLETTEIPSAPSELRTSFLPASGSLIQWISTGVSSKTNSLVSSSPPFPPSEASAPVFSPSPPSLPVDSVSSLPLPPPFMESLLLASPDLVIDSSSFLEGALEAIGGKEGFGSSALSSPSSNLFVAVSSVATAASLSSSPVDVASPKWWTPDVWAEPPPSVAEMEWTTTDIQSQSGEIRIRLDPPDLGTVDVMIEWDNEQQRIKVDAQVEKPWVMQAWNETRVWLEQSLRNSGWSLDSSQANLSQSFSSGRSFSSQKEADSVMDSPEQVLAPLVVPGHRHWWV